MADKLDKLIEKAKDENPEMVSEPDTPVTVEDMKDKEHEPILPEVKEVLDKTSHAIDEPNRQNLKQNLIREMALLLLDDPNGINDKAYKILSVMLIESHIDDLFKEVTIINGRAFINEIFAEEELTKL